MNFQTASEENLILLVEEIKSRLKLVNASLIRPEDFDLASYSELLEIYEMIVKKQQLTMMEIEGVLDELKSLKK